MRVIAIVFLVTIFFYSGCKNEDLTVIGYGEMPDALMAKDDNLHVVYGSGDSILYASIDSNKKVHREHVGVIKDLAASHMRGPQLAQTSFGLTIIACNQQGDIFTYSKEVAGNWKPGGRVNDQDTVAKENLVSITGDGELLYAVWLDLRSSNNQLYGARSANGGLSWGRNDLIYASPDTTVCECCKPTVVMRGNRVVVQFRNWLDENRDMYLIQSEDAGTTFGKPEKLGEGSWKLDGCPMDGGDFIFNEDEIQTVWRRKGMMYTCEPGNKEIELAEGKNPVINIFKGQPVYAWSENGTIMIRLPGKEKRKVGKGRGPVLITSNDEVLCIYEEDNVIRKVVIN